MSPPSPTEDCLSPEKKWYSSVGEGGEHPFSSQGLYHLRTKITPRNAEISRLLKSYCCIRITTIHVHPKTETASKIIHDGKCECMCVCAWGRGARRFRARHYRVYARNSGCSLAWMLTLMLRRDAKHVTFYGIMKLMIVCTVQQLKLTELSCEKQSTWKTTVGINAAVEMDKIGSHKRKNTIYIFFF